MIQEYKYDNVKKFLKISSKKLEGKQMAGGNIGIILAKKYKYKDKKYFIRNK